MSKTLIKLEQVKKHFPLETGLLSKFSSKDLKVVHAVDDVSLQIAEGETFSLVGETGSGKTTTGKLMVRLLEPTSGSISFKDKDIFKMNRREVRLFKKSVGMVFQDPLASLNPRLNIESVVSLPLKIHEDLSASERKERVIELLDKVGLRPPERIIKRNPHEFSGGQRQRIGVARAIALNPDFIVLDEPVASLDVSIRAQILNLLKDIKAEFGLTYLLIVHDLNVVRYMSDWVFVMYLGMQAELAKTSDIFTSPKHPYTKALLSAIPIPDPAVKMKALKLKGELPSPVNPPSGCRFHTRCPYVMPVCKEVKPEPIKIEEDHWVFCHLYSSA